MVDNPLRHFPQIARAGGDSATFHYEVVDDVPATIAAAREHGLQVGVAFNPESEPEDVAAVAGGRRPRPLHEHPSRLQRPEVHARRGRPDRAAARALPARLRSRSTAGSTTRRSGRARGRRDLLVAGSAIFGGDDPARATGASPGAA
jgi:hypothetical protein